MLCACEHLHHVTRAIQVNIIIIIITYFWGDQEMNERTMAGYWSCNPSPWLFKHLSHPSGKYMRGKWCGCKYCHLPCLLPFPSNKNLKTSEEKLKETGLSRLDKINFSTLILKVATSCSTLSFGGVGFWKYLCKR